MELNQCAKYITENNQRIVDYLNKVVEEKRFNYRTFGTEIESFVLDVLYQILKEGKFITHDKDFIKPETKNTFPDLILTTTKPNLVIEIKSGCRNKRERNGEYTTKSNSNNDMGTLNSWENKLHQFNQDNIYYLFIEYNLSKSGIKIFTVKLAPFYNFLALNKDKVLKYREKDGNLRPKDFDKASEITSLEQFMKLLPSTNIYRSTRIIKKHFRNLPDREQKKILLELNR